MATLENVPVEDLRQILAEVDDADATKRLMAAITYKEMDELTQADAAALYGFSSGWASKWFNRLERLADEPFEDVVYVNHALDGLRNSLTRNTTSSLRLSMTHHKKLASTRPRGLLHSRVTISSRNSTLSIVNAMFDDYSRRPGCHGRQPGRSSTNPTREHRKRGKTASKKRDRLDDEYTILAIDQTRQVLSTLTHAWFPEGERPSLPVTGAWDSIKLLGAVSDTGDSFFLPCAENFNSDTTTRLLDALQTEFGEKICVVLDNASYFTANAVQEFVEDTPIELCYLPRGSPELNPAENCWKKLNQELGNRLFDTLDELRDAALAALDRINPPNLFTYLCP